MPSSPCPRCRGKSMSYDLDESTRIVPKCLACGWEGRLPRPPLLVEYEEQLAFDLGIAPAPLAPSRREGLHLT